jgi:hypothetical protein
LCVGGGWGVSSGLGVLASVTGKFCLAMQYVASCECVRALPIRVVIVEAIIEAEGEFKKVASHIHERWGGLKER